MSWFKRTYFIQSTTDRTDGTKNENWTIKELYWGENLVHYVNEYRHRLENEHGGICMINSIRRI